jgi:hypothetical protein
MSAVQKGTELKVSFGAYSYASYVPEEISIEHPNGNVEIHRNADGATMTKIFMDPSTKLSGTFLIEAAAGSITPPIEGATVTLTPPQGTSTAYMAEAGCSVKFSAGAAKLSLNLIKEGSMTYT